mgnify:CR=1 FL=1
MTLAEAYKESEQLRGEGDAKAAKIYADAFNQNKEFFSFHRSLNAYRTAFGDGGNMMVLQPESDFFRYFKENTASVPAAAQESGAVTAAIPEASAVPVPQAAAPVTVTPVAPAPVAGPQAAPEVAPPPFSADP